MLDKIKMVAGLRKREKETHGSACPTDAEVVAAVEVFNFLIYLGNVFGLEMLSSWAVVHFSYYNGVSWARDIANQVNLNAFKEAYSKFTTGKQEVDEAGEAKKPYTALSPRYAIDMFAGMRFTDQNGRDAYDYLKKRLTDEGFKL